MPDISFDCRNTYSALSALAGHYNSFGPETNVPKKRLDRLTKVCSFLKMFSEICLRDGDTPAALMLH